MTDIMTQRKRILDYLSQGFTLTPLAGLSVAGTMKLSTRIGELIREGHPIEKEWLTTASGKRVMSYKLRREGNDKKIF